MTTIAVAGAGSIGCFVGGLLAAGGHEVTLLGRSRVLDDIASNGLNLTDFSGLSRHVRAAQLKMTTDPADLAGSDVVLVCVKTAGTAEIAQQIEAHATPEVPVVSLQNGLEASETLRSLLHARPVRAGMVPFNVVPKEAGVYHRASSGEIVIEDGRGALGQILSVPGLPVIETDQIASVQWGKLLFNLSNAPNALSGLTVQQMLLDRDWRRLMADQMSEALQVLNSAGIAATPPSPVPARFIPSILRLPTGLFRRIAAQMLTIDPSARASMSYDLMQGRATEIGALQGRLIEMGKAQGVPTPVLSAVAARIAEAEAAEQGLPNLSPAQVRG